MHIYSSGNQSVKNIHLSVVLWLPAYVNFNEMKPRKGNNYWHLTGFHPSFYKYLHITKLIYSVMKRKIVTTEVFKKACSLLCVCSRVCFSTAGCPNWSWWMICQSRPSLKGMISWLSVSSSLLPSFHSSIDIWPQSFPSDPFWAT